MTLTKGTKYDLTTLVCSGWKDNDHCGYHVLDYFTGDGVYLGPDVDGMEPIFTDAAQERENQQRTCWACGHKEAQ